METTSILNFFQHLFATSLSGFWAKFLALGCLSSSVYYGVIRKTSAPSIAIGFFVITIALTFGGWLLGVMGLI